MIKLMQEEIIDVKVTGGPRNWTKTGYGEHALSCMLLVGSRWHRLYILHYGNGGASPHIKRKGELVHLDPYAEELVSLVFAN